MEITTRLTFNNPYCDGFKLVLFAKPVTVRFNASRNSISSVVDCSLKATPADALGEFCAPHPNDTAANTSHHSPIVLFAPACELDYPQNPKVTHFHTNACESLRLVGMSSGLAHVAKSWRYFDQSCCKLIRVKQGNTVFLPTNNLNITRFPAEHEHLH